MASLLSLQIIIVLANFMILSHFNYNFRELLCNYKHFLSELTSKTVTTFKFVGDCLPVSVTTKYT